MLSMSFGPILYSAMSGTRSLGSMSDALENAVSGSSIPLARVSRTGIRSGFWFGSTIFGSAGFKKSFSSHPDIMLNTPTQTTAVKTRKTNVRDNVLWPESEDKRKERSFRTFFSDTCQTLSRPLTRVLRHGGLRSAEILQEKRSV